MIILAKIEISHDVVRLELCLKFYYEHWGLTNIHLETIRLEWQTDNKSLSKFLCKIHIKTKSNTYTKQKKNQFCKLWISPFKKQQYVRKWHAQIFLYFVNLVNFIKKYQLHKHCNCNLTLRKIAIWRSKIFYEKMSSFWLFFLQSNGNFPEGQIKDNNTRGINCCAVRIMCWNNKGEL